MDWFTNFLQKNKDVKIDSNNSDNNSSNNSNDNNNDNNDKNDSNTVKDDINNSNININETIDNSGSNNSSVNDNSNGTKNDIDNNDKNDNDGIASESLLPKKCYTLDELRRVEKRLGKMELPDDISEYVNSGDFRSISKSTGQSNNMGKRQAQGQGQGQGQQVQNRGYGNRQMPNQGQGTMQGNGQRQGNGQGQGNSQGQGQNFRNPKQGEDSWSRNRTLPQHQQQDSIQNNNNNNNTNYERKLTIAEQKLLFEQERKKILAERQKEYDDNIVDGEATLKFRDETDILLEEMAGNQSNRAGSEGTKISFNTLLLSSEGDRSHQHRAPVDSNGNSVVIQFSSLNSSKEEVIPAPVQPDIWSSFLDTNLSPDIFGNSIFGNPAPSSSRRGQSRLGAILSLDSSPQKSDNKLNFDNDDTLDLTNPSLFAEALPPSPNSRANNRLNVQSLFSAARQNPNSNPSPESAVEHKIIKSSDVLSRLGFEGHQSSEPSPPQDSSSSPTPPNSSSSPFTFHGQDSSAKKTKKQSGGMSVASRMQLMKMGKKIDNGEKSKPAETSAAPVTPPPLPLPTPPPASESEASVTNMKRINLNSLFVKQG